MKVKYCEDCGSTYHPTKHNNRWCDKCSIKRIYNPPVNKNGFPNAKYMKSTNYDDPKMKQHWQQQSKESIHKILSKCNGTNYKSIL